MLQQTVEVTAIIRALAFAGDCAVITLALMLLARYVKKRRKEGQWDGTHLDRFVIFMCIAALGNSVEDGIWIADRVTRGEPMLWYGAPIILCVDLLVVYAFFQLYAYRGMKLPVELYRERFLDKLEIVTKTLGETSPVAVTGLQGDSGDTGKTGKTGPQGPRGRVGTTGKKSAARSRKARV
jgi:hypothetical protein